eukprot:SM000005S17304  [mRNA]  locus=s5:1351050:1356072:+ [translate_table: standard]
MSGMKRFPDSSAGPRGGSRAALFDGIEEGGIRASSSSYSDEIAEQDNERAVDGLQDRVNVLKRLTTDIHEEVHQHNRLLDMMGNGMDATRGMLAGTADRFSKPPSAPASGPTPALPSSRRVHSSPGNTQIKREVGSEYSNGKATVSSLFPRSTEITHTTTTSSYEPTPEGLREAVKAGDVAAVRELLGKGLTADYQDKQGMTLAHLAAMFNHTEVVMLLMENGACMTKVNSQGETPIDCAPATLGLRMRQKMASILAQ